MSKHKIEIELPDNCASCGEPLTVGKKVSKNGYTTIIRPCYTCKKIDKITLKTTFTEDDREVFVSCQN